jgi:hypothetical protein
MRETPFTWVNFTSLMRARFGAGAALAAGAAFGATAVAAGAAAGTTTGAGGAAGFALTGATAAATADGDELDGAGVAEPRVVTAMPPATRFTW